MSHRPALVALAITALFTLPALKPANAQISGFGSNFQLNGVIASVDENGTTYGASAVPSVSPDGSTLQLTDTNRNANYFGSPAADEASSAFYLTPQNIGAFTTSFTYQEDVNGSSGGPDPADGWAFVLQNDSRGASALGDPGERFGYGTNGTGTAIDSSAAVEFNIYGGRPVGTNLYTDGNTGADDSPAYNVPGTVNIASGDPILINLSYDGSLLSETLTDQTTSDTYTTSYNTDLSSILGGSTAYVGFTGGTGGGVANQYVSNFSFTPQAVPEASSAVSFGILGILASFILLRKRTKNATAA